MSLTCVVAVVAVIVVISVVVVSALALLCFSCFITDPGSAFAPKVVELVAICALVVLQFWFLFIVVVVVLILISSGARSACARLCAVGISSWAG